MCLQAYSRAVDEVAEPLVNGGLPWAMN